MTRLQALAFAINHLNKSRKKKEFEQAADALLEILNEDLTKWYKSVKETESK